MTGEKLADDEVTSGSVTTDVFPKSTRTYRYPRFARRIIGASSPVSMTVRRWCAAASPSAPVMVSLGEHFYSIYKP